MSSGVTLQIRPAKRSESKPLVGFYSESGTGKTYSALLLARGFVGPQGRIVMIETEGGRGESYSDPNEYPEIGGYEVVPVRDNFAPAVYGQAISVCEKAGNVDALIIDSASHEWEGVGGVLSMAAENAKTKKGVLVWQVPKIEHHRQFMLRLIGTPIPLVIVCMRAKAPMIEVPKRDGTGKEWVRAPYLEPKQADDILYELFVHGWIDHEHKFHLTKSTAKALAPVFADGQPITLETGQRMAAWARGVKLQPAPDNDEQYALAAAEDMAKSGTAAYRNWWNVQTAAVRKIIGTERHEQFKRQAADNDQAGQQNDAAPE